MYEGDGFQQKLFGKSPFHVLTKGEGGGGEFHISHDASLLTILSSFRTHVILSVLISSTGTRQFFIIIILTVFIELKTSFTMLLKNKH